jgi:hypothetical protein
MFFLMSVTVAAAANNSEVKKGSHVAKKVKKAVDPDISAGKTELTPLQANKYNLGDYAGSSTTIDTPDGNSNTINMGVNAGIQFDDGPYPGNKILEGDHAGTTFNFGNFPGITFDNAPEHGIGGGSSYSQDHAFTKLNSGTNAGTTINAGKYVGQKFDNPVPPGFLVM